jgi:hypothetical protein
VIFFFSHKKKMKRDKDDEDDLDLDAPMTSRRKVEEKYINNPELVVLFSPGVDLSGLLMEPERVDYSEILKRDNPIIDPDELSLSSQQQNQSNVLRAKSAALRKIITKHMNVRDFMHLAIAYPRTFGVLGRMDDTWKDFFKRDMPDEFNLWDGQLPPFVPLYQSSDSEEKFGELPPWKRYYLHTRQLFVRTVRDIASSTHTFQSAYWLIHSHRENNQNISRGWIHTRMMTRLHESMLNARSAIVREWYPDLWDAMEQLEKRRSIFCFLHRDMFFVVAFCFATRAEVTLTDRAANYFSKKVWKDEFMLWQTFGWMKKDFSNAPSRKKNGKYRIVVGQKACLVCGKADTTLVEKHNHERWYCDETCLKKKYHV